MEIFTLNSMVGYNSYLNIVGFIIFKKHLLLQANSYYVYGCVDCAWYSDMSGRLWKYYEHYKVFHSAQH